MFLIAHLETATGGRMQDDPDIVTMEYDRKFVDKIYDKAIDLPTGFMKGTIFAAKFNHKTTYWKGIYARRADLDIPLNDQGFCFMSVREINAIIDKYNLDESYQVDMEYEIFSINPSEMSISLTANQRHSYREFNTLNINIVEFYRAFD